MRNDSGLVATREGEPVPAEVMGRHQRPPQQAFGRKTAARPDLLLALARADWLVTALSDLPIVDPDGPWQSAVHQRHARRHAEFALAACLRSVQMGRATITMAEAGATSIRMYGVRASSINGFGPACRLWVEAARRQASVED